MSSIVYHRIVCDGENCGIMLVPLDKELAEIRDRLVLAGWIRRGGKDYCFLCAPKIQEQEEEKRAAKEKIYFTPIHYCKHCGKVLYNSHKKYCNEKCAAVVSIKRRANRPSISILTDPERLQIEQCAIGGCSGRLSEWPLLLQAFTKLNYELSPNGCIGKVHRDVCQRLLAKEKQYV